MGLKFLFSLFVIIILSVTPIVTTQPVSVKSLIIEYMRSRVGHKLFANYFPDEDEFRFTNLSGSGICGSMWTLGLQFRYGIFEFEGLIMGPPEIGKWQILFGLERFHGNPLRGIIDFGVVGSGTPYLRIASGIGNVYVYFLSGEDWLNSYHKFKLEWRRDRLELWVDGNRIIKIDNSSIIPQKPMSIILEVCQSADTQTDGEVRVRNLVYKSVSGAEIWEGPENILNS